MSRKETDQTALFDQTTFWSIGWQLPQTTA